MMQRVEARAARLWRGAPWALAGLILLAPLVAMQITEEVNWNLADFIVAGALLAAACGAYELAARGTRNTAYRAGAGLALATALLLVWINLAVGIIGSEDNPANLMFAGVVIVALLGAALARFRPAGMARAFFATALAQALTGMIALVAELGVDAPSYPEAVVGLTGLFTVLWLIAAWLFRRAAGRR